MITIIDRKNDYMIMTTIIDSEEERMVHLDILVSDTRDKVVYYDAESLKRTYRIDRSGGLKQDATT